MRIAPRHALKTRAIPPVAFLHLPPSREHINFRVGFDAVVFSPDAARPPPTPLSFALPRPPRAISPRSLSRYRPPARAPLRHALLSPRPDRLLPVRRRRLMPNE